MGDSKKKVTLIGLSALLLVAMVVAIAVGVKNAKNGKDNDTDISTSSKVATALCSSAEQQYKKSCEDNVKSANTTDPRELVRMGFELAVKSVKEALQNSSTLNDLKKDPETSQALEICKDMMQSSIDDIEYSLNKMDKDDLSSSEDVVHELRIMLSGALTFEYTCLDQFDNINGSQAGEKMKKILKSSLALTSNGLAMVTQLSKLLSALGGKRKLLSDAESEFPSWLSEENRRLLAQDSATIKPNLVVALDGSGQFKSLSEALKSVPRNSVGTFVIKMKAGIYRDYVSLDQKLTNILLIGDGPTRTRITNNKNNAAGVRTMLSATVCEYIYIYSLISYHIYYHHILYNVLLLLFVIAVMGQGFMAKDIGFENTAGPNGHQAVALRIQAHQAVFYNCHMDAFQDTLYVHAHSQFFRDCSISGTVDFIFGNAAVIFQNCQLIVRKPNNGQSCMVTAQGRLTQNDPTGIVIQNCHIMGDRDYIPVKDISKAYLGRPWKPYAVTVVMQSQIDDIIQPQGWSEWMGDYGLNTLFYAEFGNRGPGAIDTNRVKWKTYRRINAQQAAAYTVGRFLPEFWIKGSGVPYSVGLMKV